MFFPAHLSISLLLLPAGTLVSELLLENVSPVLHPPPLFLVEFAKLIQAIWTSPLNDVVSPSEFKTQIQRYAPRFVGYK